MLWLDSDSSKVPRTGDAQKLGSVEIMYQTADRLSKRLTLGKVGYGKALHYFCSFSVNLKLFQNNKSENADRMGSIQRAARGR